MELVYRRGDQAGNGCDTSKRDGEKVDEKLPTQRTHD